MTTTTTISDTLVELDNLYRAYENLLTEAKRQLESLDVTEAQMARLTDKVVKNQHLIDNVSIVTKSQIIDFLKEASADDRKLNGLVEALADRCTNKINTVLEEYIQDYVGKYLEERLSIQTSKWFSENPVVQQSFEANDTLTHMLKFLGYVPANTDTSN